ncbi:effector-associated domain EAD1-containing protein [Streptosporangium sp. H16]|uniref:effector-associated domain EAD1-containing protein n=1 Tax=Streptosporangium sp. H16 TaxID=3444184 RepID=UPI003F7A91CA
MRDEFTSEEITELAGAFSLGPEARWLLDRAGFPPAMIPAMRDVNGGDFWWAVGREIARGVMPDGRRRLMAVAAERYPNNPVFQAALRDAAPETTRHPSETVTATRVMAVGASPRGHLRVRADREARAIQEAARLGHLDVLICPAAQAADLKRLREFQPDILHLSCHGDGKNLIFEDVHGGEHPVPAGDVVETLRHHREAEGGHLRGLVLGSCHSVEIASRFTEVADQVIAHRGELDDACAIAFARHLYEDLHRIPDLGRAARNAARDAVNTDHSCTGVLTGLVVLPERGPG